MMKYSEQFMEYIEYTFAAFCNVVLRNAAINAYRDFRRKQRREVSLEYLISETSLEPFTTDSYFEQYDKPTIFVVKGQAVIVESERLADALSRSPEQRRTVLQSADSNGRFCGAKRTRCGASGLTYSD